MTTTAAERQPHGNVEGAMEWLMEIVRDHGQNPVDDAWVIAEYRAVGWVKATLDQYAALKKIVGEPIPPA